MTDTSKAAAKDKTTSETETETAGSSTLLTVQDLTKTFALKGSGGKVVHAVDDVSLTIPHGQTVGLVGESGSGKTTLARMVLGLLKPTSGSITIDGIAISKHNRKAWQPKMGAVFQDPASSLNPRWTVRQILTRPLSVNGVSGADELIDHTCELVGLGKDLLDRRPGSLSGGQQQRVSVARAIMLRPELLVLDEPTSALDVSVQAQTLNVLLDLQDSEHLAYLFITHNLSVVRYMADRICVMYAGRLMETGTTKEVMEDHRHPYTAELISSMPALHPSQRDRHVATDEGEVPSLTDLGSGCPFAPRCPRADAHCTAERPGPVEVAPGHVAWCHKAK